MGNAFITALNLRGSKEVTVKDMHKSCAVYFSNKNNNPPIVIDTGATLSLNPNASDFVGNI